MKDSKQVYTHMYRTSTSIQEKHMDKVTEGRMRVISKYCSALCQKFFREYIKKHIKNDLLVTSHKQKYEGTFPLFKFCFHFNEQTCPWIGFA